MHRMMIAAAVFTVANVAQAQGTPRMEQREANQAARIEQGAASGALTGAEARRLEAGQQRIDRMERGAAADGRVTAGERRRIEAAQDVQSRRIARQKHDRQHDFNHDGRVDRPRRRN